MNLIISSFLISISISGITVGSPTALPPQLQHDQKITDPAQKRDVESINEDESDTSDALIRYQAQQESGYYKFGYAVADGQYRVEEGSPQDGILGSYGYVDSNGKIVKVFYKADSHGFQILTPEVYQILLEAKHMHEPAYDKKYDKIFDDNNGNRHLDGRHGHPASDLSKDVHNYPKTNVEQVKFPKHNLQSHTLDGNYKSNRIIPQSPDIEAFNDYNLEIANEETMPYNYPFSSWISDGAGFQGPQGLPYPKLHYRAQNLPYRFFTNPAPFAAHPNIHGSFIRLRF